MYSSTKSIKLNKLCKSILNSDEAVCAVAIIGKSGAVLEKIGLDEKKLNKENYHTRFNECLLDIALGKDFGEFYGPIRYHFSQDKSVMFSFPFEENFVCVTTTKNASPIWLATKIAQIIARYIALIKNS